MYLHLFLNALKVKATMIKRKEKKKSSLAKTAVSTVYRTLEPVFPSMASPMIQQETPVQALTVM